MDANWYALVLPRLKILWMSSIVYNTISSSVVQDFSTMQPPLYSYNFNYLLIQSCMLLVYLFVDVMMPEPPVLKLEMMLVLKIIKEVVKLDRPGVGV